MHIPLDHQAVVCHRSALCGSRGRVTMTMAVSSPSFCKCNL